MKPEQKPTDAPTTPDPQVQIPGVLPIVPAVVPPTAPATEPPAVTPPTKDEQIAALMARLDDQATQIKGLTATSEETVAKEAATAAKEKEAADKAEETKATEAGKLPELLEQRRKELEEAQDATEKQHINFALSTAGVAAGIADPGFVQMADTSEVKLTNGAVTGATEAIAALKEKHPALFNAAPEGGNVSTEQETLAGGPANPTAPQEQELSAEHKAFQAISGWDAFGGRFANHATGTTVTYGDMWTGTFDEGLYHTARGEK